MKPWQRLRRKRRQPIKGKFVALPESTLKSKAWKQLNTSTRCVYITMLRRYYRKGKRANGCVTWSQVELEKKSGMSLRTVNRCVDKLIEEDWLTIWEPGGRWAKGTTYKVNPVYADGRE